MKKANILGVAFDIVNLDTAVHRVQTFLSKDTCHTIVTPNPEIVENSRNNSKLKQALDNADLTVADGIGIIYASKILSLDLKQRVTGIDLMNAIIKLAEREDKSIYLLGAKPNVAKIAAKNLKTAHPKLRIAGYRDGYFKEVEEKDIIGEINSLKTDILFVALGSPKQEIFMQQYRDELTAKVTMGVGGSFDVIAGTVKRAPVFYQKLGLEWLYRAVKEPKRFVRLLSIPKFLVAVFKSR